MNHRQRLLDRGRGFKPRGKNSFYDEMRGHARCVDTRASEKIMRITADTTCLQQGHKTFSEQNKQFDHGRRREKASLWNAAVTLPSFSGESWKAPCLLSVCASCSVLCVCLFPKLLIYPGDTSQQAERHEGRHGSSR